jgi:hypothetical protein
MILSDEEKLGVWNEVCENGGNVFEALDAIERAVLAKVSQQNRCDATGRTAHDYAIEHAEYMATSAEQLLNHLNECTNIDDGVIEPDENYSDYTSGLRCSIHDFRKRRDRAKEMPATKPAPPQAAAIPEYVTVSQVPHSQYAQGWNDCLDYMLSASPKLEPKPMIDFDYMKNKDLKPEKINDGDLEFFVYPDPKPESKS